MSVCVYLKSTLPSEMALTVTNSSVVRSVLSVAVSLHSRHTVESERE